MLKINIAGHSYRIPTHWEDISLSECARLYERVNEAPAEVKEYYLSFISGNRPSVTDDLTTPIEFVFEVMEYLCRITKNMLQSMGRKNLLELSDSILPRFVCGVMGSVDYQPTEARSFRRRFTQYYYPTMGCDVMGKKMPLSKLCAAELCQVSDIVMSGNLTLAPLALALCCRPQGEEYNEARAQHRAKKWGKLPASVYWELWTQTSAAHEYLRDSFPECYGKGKSERGSSASMWSDQLVAMAVGNPSALTYLQSMNGYDFVHLMNENIKNKTEQWKMSAALSGLGVR